MPSLGAAWRSAEASRLRGRLRSGMRIVLSRASRSLGASLVLSDVTLSVPTEARIGIVGPNGVGKSTLLRLLSGVEEPDGGTVTREPATIRVGLAGER